MPPDSKKSFLWLTENYPPSRGGMAQSCDRIIQGLREKGFQIHVYHFTNRKKPFIAEKKLNGTYTALPVFESEPHTLNLAWNHIQTRIGHFNEIIVFGGYLPVIAAPVFSKLSGIPLVTLLRGNDFDISIFSPRRRGLLHETIEASRAVGAITLDKVEKIKSLYPATNVHYTPNGIRLEDWKCGKSDAEFSQKWKQDHVGDKVCIGIFGELKEKKGIDIFINSLDAQLFRDNVFLLMIGEIDQVYLTQIDNSGIAYHLSPFMDRYELLKYYGICDLIAIPSHYDGMPNVLLEAGALGIPVLGSNIDGMKDVIKQGESGLLFSSGDKNDCRDKLVQFISMQPGERKRMGEALSGRIESDYNHVREIENYYKILSDKYHLRSLYRLITLVFLLIVIACGSKKQDSTASEYALPQPSSMNEYFHISDTGQLEIASIVIGEIVELHIGEEYLFRECRDESKCKYKDENGQSVYEVKFSDTGFKIRDPQGSLIFKVKSANDKIKIGMDEQMDNPFQIKESSPEKSRLIRGDEEAGNIRMGQGTLPVKVTDGENTFFMAGKRKSSSGVVLALPDTDLKLRIILLTELLIKE